MKKKIFTFLVAGFVAFTSFSQVFWAKDIQSAKEAALKSNKLIIADFWADWCGPCRAMDKALWNTPEMAKYRDQFIFAKIDIDNDPASAVSYQATTIPKVMILDPNDGIIWNQTGFGGPDVFLEKFSQLQDQRIPSKDFSKLLNKEDKELSSYNIGRWYQTAANEIEDKNIARDMLKLSDTYLKVATKADNNQLAIDAEYNMILNIAYGGNISKAIKKISKMDENDMKNFVLAYCYQCEGQDEKMREFSDKIKSEELMARLKESSN